MTDAAPCAIPDPLLTDLYQLTMACGYWRAGMHDHRAVFHLTFRSQPFGGGFSIAAGLEPVIAYLRRLRFSPDDLRFLAGVPGSDGAPLFDRGFLDYLAKLEFTCDVDAVPEGSVVFPGEPLVRVRGPLLQAQIVETALLNTVNFQTLIATKAARVVLAAGGDPVLEFGLRRAQGPDGALAASRASFIGGCHSTSNVLAGQLLGIPISGTHAHSWIMAFGSEEEAFEKYAEVMPNNALFLVDTYDTLEGVRRAVAVGHELRARGRSMLGVRLDSGDLAWLSIEARKILDAGGFPEAKIVATNDLDEHIIVSLKQQRAAIDIWGVGTKLVTAFDQPALGGVYKLSAIETARGWEHRIKLSEQTAKISVPGILQVRRFSNSSGLVGDMLVDELADDGDGERTIVDPHDPTRHKTFADSDTWEPLLVPVVRQGRFVYEPPTLEACREHTRSQIASLHPSVLRFVNPHVYPVGLSHSLQALRTKLIVEAREKKR